MPIVAWLPSYDRSSLRFDLIAGATIWGLLVPESIAYAGLAGLPPEAGLYTLLATLAAYACFGTSRHLVVAATSAAAVLLASSVADVGPASAAEYAADGAALVLFCGALFLVAGLLGLGFVAQFLSRPVMEGFVFGLAIFVTVSQLPKLFGIEKGDGDTIRQFAHLLLGENVGLLEQIPCVAGKMNQSSVLQNMRIPLKRGPAWRKIMISPPGCARVISRPTRAAWSKLSFSRACPPGHSRS